MIISVSTLIAMKFDLAKKVTETVTFTPRTVNILNIVTCSIAALLFMIGFVIIYQFVHANEKKKIQREGYENMV